jgi:hypothetical protein
MDERHKSQKGKGHEVGPIKLIVASPQYVVLCQYTRY